MQLQQIIELIQKAASSAWAPLVALALLCLLLIGLLAKLVRSRKTKRIANLYTGQLHLFTAAERLFYQTLRKAVGDKYEVHGKLRLVDVVEPKKRLGKSRRQMALDQISNMHVDFVLVRPDSLAVACVVKLDDSNPTRRGRVKVDRFLDDVLSHADIPIARFQVQPLYSVEEIKAGLFEALQGPTETGEPRLVR